MRVIVVAIIIALIICAGCQPNPKTVTANPITVRTAEVKIVSESIDKSAKVIAKQAEEIKVIANSPEPEMPVISSKAEVIIDESVTIQESTEVIDEGAEAIDKEATVVNKALAKLKEKNAKLESKPTKVQSMLAWIVGGSLVGAVLFVLVAIYLGRVKTGVIGACSCIAVMFMAVTVSQYLNYIAIAGLIAIAAGIGYVVYLAVVNRKALVEVVKGGEAFKSIKSDSEYTFNASQKIAQSERTRAEVKKIIK